MCRSIWPEAACTTVRWPSTSTPPRVRRLAPLLPADGRVRLGIRPEDIALVGDERHRRLDLRCREPRRRDHRGDRGRRPPAARHRAGEDADRVEPAGAHRVRATTTALLRPAVRPQPATALTHCRKGDDHAHRHPQLDAPGIHQAHDRAHARDRRRRARDLGRARPVRPEGSAQAAGRQRPQVLGLGHADAGRTQPGRQRTSRNARRPSTT